MKTFLFKYMLIVLFVMACKDCYAGEPSYYVYDYTYDVNTQKIYDVFGWKKKIVVKFSDDSSKAYVKEPKEKGFSHPYFFAGLRNNWWVYQRTDYRSDGIPYFPTISFSYDFKTMTEDFGDHTAFNTLNVYQRTVK